jgi:outer membrane protein assembly factor BamB
VVVGSGDGRVYVIDLTTGKLVWEFEAGAGFSGSPAIADGRVVIGDIDGRVYAFGK